jgi:hypothetical protein
VPAHFVLENCVELLLSTRRGGEEIGIVQHGATPFGV